MSWAWGSKVQIDLAWNKSDKRAEPSSNQVYLSSSLWKLYLFYWINVVFLNLFKFRERVQALSSRTLRSSLNRLLVNQAESSSNQKIRVQWSSSTSLICTNSSSSLPCSGSAQLVLTLPKYNRKGKTTNLLTLTIQFQYVLFLISPSLTSHTVNNHCSRLLPLGSAT